MISKVKHQICSEIAEAEVKLSPSDFLLRRRVRDTVTCGGATCGIVILKRCYWIRSRIYKAEIISVLILRGFECQKIKEFETQGLIGKCSDNVVTDQQQLYI